MVIRSMLLLVLATTGSRAAAQVTGAAPAWRLVTDVPLPGKPARFDYQSFDASTGWLWIAHMGAGQVLAFDVMARQVAARVPDLPGVSGIRAVPTVQRVFASLSAGHAVAVLDSRDGHVIARVSGGRFPDGISYAPRAHKLYVSDEYGRQELVIDVATSTSRRPIPLGGEVGNTQYDSVTGRIWAAVQTRNELAALDPLADSVVERVAVPGVEHPHGFYLDAPRRLAYVTGEASGTLGVLDLRTKRVVHTYRVGDEPDVLDLDPVRHRLYVACESGVITPFEVRGDTLVALPEYHAPHAHSVAVDPSTGLIYVPLEDLQGRPTLRILRLE
ncbi:MAG TPA: YncE family protein [Gemmatimonadales bacterium]|nr:YncE family protein [Gemmatimonadales bacterium]